MPNVIPVMNVIKIDPSKEKKAGNPVNLSFWKDHIRKSAKRQIGTSKTQTTNPLILILWIYFEKLKNPNAPTITPNHRKKLNRIICILCFNSFNMRKLFDTATWKIP